jgi:hypothetical protein
METVIDKNSNAYEEGITLDDFKQLVASIPHAVAQRIKWAETLSLHTAFARHLKPGLVFDQLCGIRAMTPRELRSACTSFAGELFGIVEAEHAKLVAFGSTGTEAAQANDKYAASAGAFKGTYGTLDDYTKGVEGAIGHPNPQVLLGMEREHVHVAELRHLHDLGLGVALGPGSRGPPPAPRPAMAPGAQPRPVSRRVRRRLAAA